MTEYGELRWEQVLEPVTGKAVPVKRGEVLRMSLVEGPQCLDFNCFNLHDYKERMEMGWTRTLAGDLRPTEDDVLISNPPRYRALMAILERSPSCLTHGFAAGCHRGMYESVFGDHEHPNCWDTLGESIGEYGLTPDDVHTPFVLWMNSTISEEKGYNYNAGRLDGEPGDHIDMMGVMDVLAVPVICGGASIFKSTGNYWYKPIKLELFAATDETLELAEDYEQKFTLRTTRRPAEFGVSEMRVERELEPTGYKPRFLNFPTAVEEFTVSLTAEDRVALEELKADGVGVDDEDAIRSAVLEWYLANRVTRKM